MSAQKSRLKFSGGFLLDTLGQIGETRELLVKEKLNRVNRAVTMLGYD